MLSAFAIFGNIYSQTTDDLVDKVTSSQVSAFQADRFGISLQFNINFTQQSPFAFRSKNKETGEITKNKINSFSQINSNINVNYIRRALHLAKKVDNIRLENACKRALEYGAHNYNIIERILKNGWDTLDEELEEQPDIPRHGNIRGSNYYK
ncbi:hypothetical protein SAMN05421741_11341 [Paenimyroides ummariense]|uniref:Uncharacterized protein n=1 Tax=Paenimyroides ummariense TaxID=913024 RepID=A0A1I5CS83_9FLAO|nr:hypothetical protein [Paenimyroides ummariense]SFN89845.1 hypothetical protein SAMN05421741_11341 [Paenimyroides ummariense]